jgi:hypothetical protein
VIFQNGAKEIYQFRIGLRPSLVLWCEPSAFPATHECIRDPGLGELGLSEPPTASECFEAMLLQSPIGVELTVMQVLQGEVDRAKIWPQGSLPTEVRRLGFLADWIAVRRALERIEISLSHVLPRPLFGCLPRIIWQPVLQSNLLDADLTALRLCPQFQQLIGGGNVAAKRPRYNIGGDLSQ